MHFTQKNAVHMRRFSAQNNAFYIMKVRKGMPSPSLRDFDVYSLARSQWCFHCTQPSHIPKWWEGYINEKEDMYLAILITNVGPMCSLIWLRKVADTHHFFCYIQLQMVSEPHESVMQSSQEMHACMHACWISMRALGLGQVCDMHASSSVEGDNGMRRQGCRHHSLSLNS